jgi:hypothetical protein
LSRRGPDIRRSPLCQRRRPSLEDLLKGPRLCAECALSLGALASSPACPDQSAERRQSQDWKHRQKPPEASGATVDGSGGGGASLTQRSLAETRGDLVARIARFGDEGGVSHRVGGRAFQEADRVCGERLAGRCAAGPQNAQQITGARARARASGASWGYVPSPLLRPFKSFTRRSCPFSTARSIAV